MASSAPKVIRNTFNINKPEVIAACEITLVIANEKKFAVTKCKREKNPLGK